MQPATEHTFSARLDCHYLLRVPRDIGPQTPLVVTLHEFGANPEIMLGLTTRLFGEDALIASLQGPNQFFRDAQARDVGYGWITNRRPAESIRLHHDMVSHVLSDLGREFGIAPRNRVLTGFSQPVSLNYRFAASRPQEVGGILGICGGLPGDWEQGDYGPVSAAVLHIARREDGFYPPSVTAQYEERLRRRAGNVEFHLIDGGHNVPSDGRALVAPWVERNLR